MWNQKIPSSETQNRGEKVCGLRRVSAGRDNTRVKGVKRHKPPSTQYIHGNVMYGIVTVVRRYTEYVKVAKRKDL